LLYVFVIKPCAKCAADELARRKKKKISLDTEVDPKDPDALELKAMNSEDHSDDILKELRIRFLRDMYIRSQKEFELFRTMHNGITYD